MAAPMIGSSPANVTGRLHAAFSKPLNQRCGEISAIINDTSVKELHTVIPLLLENIFGFNNQLGWGISRVYKSHYQDFSILRQFLSPQGPLLRLIYRLLQDPYCRYEFPVSCIPFPSRCAIDEGVLPAFYASKVQIHQAGRPYGMLSLNAFEYYFFHFSYFLVNPGMQRISTWSNPSEALYPNLVEDYLSFFLPADGKVVPNVPQATTPVRSPLAFQSSNYRTQSPNVASPSASLSRLHMSTLFKNLSPAQRTSPQTNISSVDVLEQPETWRSQTFLQILVEFWLSQNAAENEKYNFSNQRGHRWSPNNQAPVNISRVDPYQYIIAESFLPSGDHVRITRMVVKHLHYFVNSARPENIASPYSSNIQSPWDEFKRAVWPQFVQKKIYAFLKHGFERWPLDSSFRLMLETWLSFIQPWRYTDLSQAHRADQDTQKDKTVEAKWAPFVMENLLFYTVLLQDVLPRFFRMDLAMPKNAYMLFRLSKVLNLPRLSDLIRDAEASLFEPIGRSMVSHDLGQSYLSRTQAPGAGRGAALGLQFSELEAPGFQYKPLYCRATADMIQQLQALILQAIQTVTTSTTKNTDSNGGGFFSWLFGSRMIDYNAPSFYNDGYDDGPGDLRKAEHHLRQALDNISNIFDIIPPQGAGGKTVTWGDTNGQRNPETLSPDHIPTDEGPQLTPLGRYQMMNGLRKFEIDYSGDPDLQPIRSFESAILVRALHHLAVFLNYRFAEEIENMYEREDFIGSVAYQFLSPPRPSPPKKKSLVSSPVSEAKRKAMAQPKVRLRWMASYQNIGYLIAGYMFVYMWFGTGIVGFALLGLVLGLLFGVLRAVVNPKPKSRTS